MKKFIIPVAFVLAAWIDTEDTPDQVADKWCKLHKAVIDAKDQAEHEKAEEAKKEYEREIEKKYNDNEKFLNEVDEKTEACEEEAGGDYAGD